MSPMLPLLLVALLAWAGFFVFLLATERKLKSLEERLDAVEVER